MRKKITQKSQVFPTLSCIKYSELKTSKERKYLLQNIIILIQKMILNYSFFSSKAISKETDLKLMKVYQLIIIPQPSMSQKTSLSNFYY